MYESCWLQQLWKEKGRKSCVPLICRFTDHYQELSKTALFSTNRVLWCLQWLAVWRVKYFLFIILYALFKIQNSQFLHWKKFWFFFLLIIYLSQKYEIRVISSNPLKSYLMTPISYPKSQTDCSYYSRCGWKGTLKSGFRQRHLYWISFSLHKTNHNMYSFCVW